MDNAIYKAVKIFSKSVRIDSFKELSDIANYITIASLALFYLDNGILIGRYSIGDDKKPVFQFDEDQLTDLNILNRQYPPIESIQKMRIFNNNEELLIWRSIKNGVLMHSGRFRLDYDKNDIDGLKEINAIYSNQVLFGTKIALRKNKNFITLLEDRGVKIILPNTDKNGGFKVDDGKSRIAIKTCNYVGFSGIYECQATYVDSRFVDFVQLS